MTASACIDTQVRTSLGIGLHQKLVLLMYGGQPAGAWRLRESALPPHWRCSLRHHHCAHTAAPLQHTPALNESPSSLFQLITIFHRFRGGG